MERLFGGGRGGTPFLGSRPLARSYTAKQGADLNILAFLNLDLAQYPGGRRIDLQGDLIGFQLDQRLIFRHLVAFSLQPLEYGGFGNRFTERWHSDLDGIARAGSSG